MGTTNGHSLLRRLRYTPVGDALRGRLTGRLDLRRHILEAELPAPAAALVERVVKRTRLWRHEKIDVADELIAHFRDGRDEGVPVDEMVRNFGDERQAAKLIRRAKRRNRPFLWHVARGVSLACLSLIGLYALSILPLLAARPHVSVDYLARLNAPILATPEEERAWPIYREALLDYPLAELQMENYLWVTNEQGHWIRPRRSGDTGWPETADFLRRIEPLLQAIRLATTKPAFGLPATPLHDLPVEDFEAVASHEAERGPLRQLRRAAMAADTPAQKLAVESLGAAIWQAHGPLPMMARLLSADMELAWAEHNHTRLLANVDAILGLARHQSQIPTVGNRLMAASIMADGLGRLGDILSRDMERWTRDELLWLAHRLAPVDDVTALTLDAHRLLLEDTLQRVYSRHGTATLDGLVFLYTDSTMLTMLMTSDEAEVGSIALSLPALNLVMALPADMMEKFDALLAMQAREAELPLWASGRPSEAALEAERLYWDPVDTFRYAPVIMHLPPGSQLAEWRDTVLAVRDAIQVVVALELYRRDESRYPADLANLAPRYMPRIPLDQSTGRPLLVRYPGDGAPLIYGRGWNGEDNGGVWQGQERTWPRVPEEGDWVLFPPVFPEQDSVPTIDPYGVGLPARE